MSLLKSDLQEIADDATSVSIASRLPRVSFSPDYDRRCLTTLETALHGVPAYQHWRAFDPGPSYPIDLRYASLPVLTKDDLRTFSPAGFLRPGCDLAAGLAGGEVEYVMTSGSTDDRVTNLWHQSWWDASERASWKLNAAAALAATGTHREAILTSPLCVGVLCENGSLPMEKRTLGRFLFLNERIDPAYWPESHLERIVAELNVFHPVVLEANPSLLGKLARYIGEKGLRIVQPKLIVLTYEYPSQIHCRQIRRVFDAPVISSYGTTETGYVFMECEAGRLHQNAEFCRVDFQPLKAAHGGPLIGQILVTTFRNPWSVILRFFVGDLVRLEASGACPCGRSDGLILASIEGRVKNLTRTPEGVVVTQRQVDTALSRVAGIAEYQLRQTATDAYRLGLVGERDAATRIDLPASEALHDLYGSRANISVHLEESFPLDGAPKYQLVKSDLPFDINECLMDWRNP